MLARTCADERGGDTGTLPPDPIRQESIALIAAAKKSGCFVDVSKVPGTRYTIRTGESEVRLVPDGRYAFVNDYVFVTDVGQDGDNVLLDDNGELRFIDPILGFKQPLLQKLAAALVDESEIAPLVYKLYGLTYDEIAIVEGRKGRPH